MGDFKLPEIVPARTFGAEKAALIDQAGAKLGAAAQAVGEFELQRAKSTLQLQSNEAALEKAKRQAEFDALFTLNGTLGAEDIRKKFPDGVPPEVEKVITRDLGGGQLEDRTDVRFHEVAPHLYKARAEGDTMAAVSRIEAPGFRTRAANAMRADDAARIEHIRAKAVALGDAVNAIRNEEIFKENLNTGTPEGFANAWRIAENTLDPKKQAEMMAAYPGMRAASEAATSVRDAVTTEQLDALASKVIANKEGEGGFFAPLSPPQQDHFLRVIGEKKKAIAEAEYRAKVALYDEKVQRVENGDFGDPRAYLLNHPEIQVPEGIERADYDVRKDRLDKLRAGEAVKDNNRLYLNIVNNPEAYRGMSEEDFARAIKYQFTPNTEQEMMRLYADRKAGRNTEPVLSPVEREAVKRAARHSLGLDPGATPSLEQDKALAQAEQDIEMQMTARKRAKPDEPITYRTAYEARTRQTAVNTTAEKGIVFTRPMTDPERQKFYNLDDPATAEAWGRLWKRTHGGAPVVSNTELYDMIDNAIKEWGADVERAWAINPLEKTPHLTATVIARLADPKYVAEVIDPQLPADSKADPKVLRRRRSLAAVQLSTPSGAEGLQAKIADQEAAVVRAEQLQAGRERAVVRTEAEKAAATKAQLEASARQGAKPIWVQTAEQVFAEREKAARDRTMGAYERKASLATSQDIPGIHIGPRAPDRYPRPTAEEKQAAETAWVLEQSRLNVERDTALSDYRQYLARKGANPDDPPTFLPSGTLDFRSWLALKDKGVAP